MKSQMSAASGHCDGDSARGGDCAATGRALGIGSREGMLLVKAWLLKLQSRSRIRRLKLSGTVQGLVQESVTIARTLVRCVGQSCRDLRSGGIKGRDGYDT